MTGCPFSRLSNFFTSHSFLQTIRQLLKFFQLTTPKQQTSLSTLLKDATDYLNLLSEEQNLSSPDVDQRLQQIYLECKQTGTYEQTYEELAYGAKVAWRNSVNCIGRIGWQNLNVRDLRHLTTAEEIFEAIVDHIQLATNQGKIRPTISIFAPQKPDEEGIRIWNPQFIRYAGYRQSDGTVIGDPDQVELTEICHSMGWKGDGTRFDVLPLIIQMPQQPPQLFPLPKEVVMEVPITHPDYAWFADLGLKWHALPAVSDWRLEIGGISYTASPFNGWYMSAEIGARNFSDPHRYNLLPVVAEKMSLNTGSKLSLWKDHALVELNVAILHSFAEQGVRIVDHHTASKQFMQHWKKEEEANRIVSAEWKRTIPPISPSATEVFHQRMQNLLFKPNFFPQTSPWKVQDQSSQIPSSCPFS
ncbi:MAG: nitric oxide synthase oxygenase [Crocosphaera sp.]